MVVVVTGGGAVVVELALLEGDPRKSPTAATITTMAATAVYQRR
jgi:hypothetical protein